MTGIVPPVSIICPLESPFPVGDSHSHADLDLAPTANTPRFDPPSVKLEIRGTTSHLQALLWSKNTIHKNTIAAKLRAHGHRDLATSLEECHTHYTFGICGDCNRVQKFPNRCDRNWCPECQPRLQRERQRAVEWWTQEIQQPKHVVLTVKNTTELSKAHVLEFKQWFTKLRRSKFASNWVGGFYSIEVTNEGSGWHLHLHALVEARWIDAVQLSSIWARVTNGMGRIVKVKDARGNSYLHEVTKYVAKGSQLAAWPAATMLEFLSAFEGVRTFGVFGSLYGKRTLFREWFEQLQSLRPRCTCGSCNMQYLSETEFLDLDLVPNSNTSSIPPPRTSDCLTPWLALDLAIAFPR